MDFSFRPRRALHELPMPSILNVYPTPQFLVPEQLEGGTVVVIDVLRATTTIVHALEAGAREVLPCVELDEARTAAAGFLPGQAVLAGERMGRQVPGFELGNSPDDYTPESIGGRTLVLTTTNGTRAMAQCGTAARVLIGAFVNAAAVCRWLGDSRQVHLLCAGRLGEVGRDDLLLAGLLVDRLARRDGQRRTLNAAAQQARTEWLGWQPTEAASGARTPQPERLAAELRNSPGGRNLASLGLEADILTASRIDRFDRVPELDTATMRIR